MSSFLADLSLIVDFIFGAVVDVWAVIQASPVLLAAFGLWVLRKVFEIFDIIKG